jgi:ParB/RepB/Spo0J family partition protein
MKKEIAVDRQFNPEPFDAPLPSLALDQNVRHTPGSVEDLAGNMSINGLYNRIICVPHSKGMWRVISGQRRTLAARMLGWETIPALKADLDKAQAVTLAISDNTCRRSMTVPDLAEAVLTLQRLMPDEPACKIAKLVNVSPSIISQIQSAMVEHPEQVKETLTNAKAGMWVWFLLRKVPDAQKNAAAIAILEKAMTRDEATDYIKGIVPSKAQVYRYVVEFPKAGGFDAFMQKVKEAIAKAIKLRKLGLDFDDIFRQL